jgi:hypothetical protein
MNKDSDERRLLDEQEARAREGIHRAVRGLSLDLMEICAIPPSVRESEVLEAGIAAASLALGHEATVELIAKSLIDNAPQGAGMAGSARRTILRALLAATNPERTNVFGL